MTNNRKARKGEVKAESNRVPIAFRLPKPMVEQLDAMAARRGVDRSALLFEMLQRGFLQISLAEIVGAAFERIASAKGDAQAVFTILDDINDRLDSIENTLKP